MRKRVLIVTQYIYPENFKSNELAFELNKRGYKVDVLTGIPNYPEGKFFKGYGVFKRRIEKINGVKIYRCFQFPRGVKAGGVRLALNYISFAFCSTLWILFYFVWKKKYDAIIIHEPSPITQLIPGCLLGIIRKVPVYSWIMDIWPDAIRNSVSPRIYKLLFPILNFITEWTYKHSDKILITSKGFEELICRTNDHHSKIVFFPNWSIDMRENNSLYDFSKLPKGFRILLAGNLGESQDLESVCECIKLLRDNKDIKWIFAGGGSRKEWLESFLDSNGLMDCSITLGRLPVDAMPSLFKQADALLATLRKGFIDLEMTVPARVQSYMSSGTPIIGMIGKGTQNLINEYDCGYAVNSGDFVGLSELIKNKILSDKESFKKKGINGRKYYEDLFTVDKCISHLEEILGFK